MGYNSAMKFYTFLIFTIALTPTLASAQSLQTLIPNVLVFTNAVLIPFLFAIAFLIFIYNAIKYFVIGASEEKGRENAKNLAIYSVAAFVFIIIFWGIINMLSSSSGLEKCKQPIFDYVTQKVSGPNLPPCGP